MKVTSNKPRGQRIFKCRKLKHGLQHKVRRPFWIEPIDNGWWFDLGTYNWTRESGGGRTSSYYAMKAHGLNDAYSLKACKRLIHKWDVPKGTKFRVSLAYVGHYFIITK